MKTNAKSVKSASNAAAMIIIVAPGSRRRRERMHAASERSATTGPTPKASGTHPQPAISKATLAAPRNRANRAEPLA